MRGLLALVCLFWPTLALAQIGSGQTLPTGNCNTGGGSLYYLTAGDVGLYVCENDVWTKKLSPGGGGLPTGLITVLLSGTCPTGFEEATELDGKTVIGTLAAHGDVGTTGGTDSITPAGTNTAPTFTGTPFTSVMNHTHPVTDPGHTHNQGLRNSGTAGTAGIQGASTANNATITNGVPSSTTGITTSNPAGGVASITPAGTISAPVFSGTAFDNRSAFIRAIFCRKT